MEALPGAAPLQARRRAGDGDDENEVEEQSEGCGYPVGLVRRTRGHRHDGILTDGGRPAALRRVARCR